MAQDNVSNISSYAANQDAYQAIAQGTTTNITTLVTSISTQLGDDTNIIRIATTKAIFVKIGAANTAATSANGFLMTDSSTDYFVCKPDYYVTIIWASETGTASIFEGA